MDLSIFCSKKQRVAKHLAVPWSFGDFTYASDGHILIRVPRIADVPENDSAPKVWEGTFGKQFITEPAEWVSVPAVDYKPVTCPICEGKAEAFMCPECEGDGEVYPSTQFHTYPLQDCITCQTSGVISEEHWQRFIKANRFKGEPIMEPCAACNETGLVWTMCHKFINGAKINEKFLWIVGNLPNAQLGVFSPLDPIRFRFDGGDGLIMPMRPDEGV